MDLLSSLPEELLSHILSSLTTKESALTSVLSKRWRYLFAFVPNLDIEDSEFLHPEEGKRERDGVLESFMDFVDRVLALQGDSPVNKVSIKCNTGIDSDRVDFWISNVLARGVSDLDLCIVLEYKYWLSAVGFKSSKLVKLKIGSEIDLGWSTESIFLPMLKTLVLDSVEFCGDKLEMLLKACPALEKLVLVYITWNDLDVTVSSASLKNLSIYGDGCPGSFSLDTPSLVSLSYSDFVAEDYPVVKMENLFEARISLPVTQDIIERSRAPHNDWLEDDDSDEDNDDDYYDVLRLNKLVKLMNGVRNVQQLYLTSDTLEVLSVCCESMPVFNNLKLLVIESDDDRGWQAMPVLLQNCPHLETLLMGGLLHFETDKCGDACGCISREDKGRALASCPVKKLTIYGFRGTKREIEMIWHFLKYFKCLEEMKIFPEEKVPTEFEVPGTFELVVKRLNLYNELSDCDVHFLVPDYYSRKWTAAK